MRNELIEEEVYESLPQELKTVASLFKGRERDVVLLSSLTTLSACFPKLYGIYDNRKVYSPLFLMVIAPPASGKGSMNYSRGIIDDINSRVYKKRIAEQKEWIRDKKEGIVVSEYPPLQTKIIPANISSAEIYSMIKNAHNSGIMIESEADTLSIMFKQDWGNFSDVLRKVFHHESISVSRKAENLYLEIIDPQLALVLSGTPDQVQPLIGSKENGLFSRFIYYTYNDISPWKNVFKESNDYSLVFKQLGEITISKMYFELNDRETELEFILNRSQIELFNQEMSKIYDDVIENYPVIFNTNVKRHGLICFRLCMIFSALRNKNILSTASIIECNEDDFNLALKLTKILLNHAFKVFEDLSSNSKLSEDDENLLFGLKPTFTRKEAVVMGNVLSISERTIDDKLKQWREKKVIKKLNHGTYQREKF